MVIQISDLMVLILVAYMEISIIYRGGIAYIGKVWFVN